MNARGLARSVGTVALIVMVMFVARGLIASQSDTRNFDVRGCTQFVTGLRTQEPYVELSVEEATRAYWGVSDPCSLLVGLDAEARDRYFAHMEKIGYRTGPNSTNQFDKEFK